MEKDIKFIHINYGEVEYHAVENELWYSYEERFETPAESGARFVTTYKAQGLIPPQVIAQGEDAIKEFAKLSADEKVNSDKERRQQRDEYKRQLRHPMEVDYQGILLKGQLRSVDGVRLSADLLEPYQGTTHVNFNMFSAMSGQYIYHGDPSYFTDYAIESGRGLLIRVYQDAKWKAENPEIHRLTERLNNQSD